jgi:hypothetical protein
MGAPMFYLKEIFLHRREGKIVLLVSIFYLAAYGLLKAFPTINPLSEFYTWMCGFMPIPMLIFYLQMGGFKRRFESSLLNTVILAIVSFTPVFMKLSVLFK